MLKNSLNARLLIKYPSPIAIIFVLFVIVHLLSRLESNSPLESIYILSFFYGTTAWFYIRNFSQTDDYGRVPANLVGLFIITFISVKTLSTFYTEFQLFWLITPPLIFLALALIIGGWRGIKCFWRALVGITFLSWLIPLLTSLASRSAILQKISADLSSYLLWYLGFQSQSHENYIITSSGGVNVNGSCTALPILLIFLSLLVILSLYFPRLIQNLPLTLAVALTIGFTLSIIRIMIMAVVVNNKPVFDYWHGTTGSNIFTSAGLFLFGGYILWQMPSEPTVTNSTPIIRGDKNPEIRLHPSLNIILWILVGLLGTSLLVRQGSVQKFTNFIFPETIPIPGWTLVKTEGLMPLGEMQIGNEVPGKANSNKNVLMPEEISTIPKTQDNVDVFTKGRRYYYEDAVSNKTLTATFWYIVNVSSSSNLVTYYQRQYPNSEILKTVTTEIDKTLPSLQGNILSFVNQNFLYYSACLTPDRETQTQSYNQITKDYNTIQVLAHKLKNFLPWFVGQRLLQDDRCLWIELKFSPLRTVNGGPHPTPRSSRSDLLWYQFTSFWGEHYPKP